MAPRKPEPPDDKTVKAAKPARAAKASTPAELASTPAKPAAKAGKATLKVVAKAATPAKADAGKPGADKGEGAMAMKLKDLVDAVVTATGAKKPDAKKAVEATLSALAGALKSGAALALPHLGKLRVAKTAGTTLTLKLRLADASKAGGKPLADDGEDG